MKYIDADLLRKEIERRRLQNRYIDTDGYEQELFEIIDSLQQEQQELAFGQVEIVEGFIAGTNQTVAVLAIPRGKYVKGDKVTVQIRKKEV